MVRLLGGRLGDRRNLGGGIGGRRTLVRQSVWPIDSPVPQLESHIYWTDSRKHDLNKSSMCYAEFFISIPAAGGALSCLRVTFGFVGYFAGASILMEYVLLNATVAGSLTECFSSVSGVEDPNSWRVEVPGFIKGYNMLDFLVVALIFLLTLCLCYRRLLLH